MIMMCGALIRCRAWNRQTPCCARDAPAARWTSLPGYRKARDRSEATTRSDTRGTVGLVGSGLSSGSSSKSWG